MTTLASLSSLALTAGSPSFPRASRPRLHRPVITPHPLLVEGTRGPVEVKLASEPWEWEQAFQLLAATYQERGYEWNTEKAYRFTCFHALPDTALFVARQDSEVVATLTLVADNDLLGLPLDALYAEEADALRRQGRRIGEVTSLASRALGQREFLSVFLTMIRLMGQYHLAQGGDTWAVTVNPRHKAFYCRLLGADPLGPCRPYPAVGDAPAEAFWFDRPLIKARTPRTYEIIFDDLVPDGCLQAWPLPRPFIRYFGSESTRTDVAELERVLRAVAEGRRVRRW